MVSDDDLDSDEELLAWEDEDEPLRDEEEKGELDFEAGVVDEAGLELLNLDDDDKDDDDGF